MLDIFLSDTFMLGVICTVLFLLVLVTVVPAFTRRPSHPQEWRVIEPHDQIVEAKRIEVKR